MFYAQCPGEFCEIPVERLFHVVLCYFILLNSSPPAPSPLLSGILVRIRFYFLNF